MKSCPFVASRTSKPSGCSSLTNKRRLERSREEGVLGGVAAGVAQHTGASVAALTIYDMCKAVDRGMCITDTRLEQKLGGKSGHWQRKSSE